MWAALLYKHFPNTWLHCKSDAVAALKHRIHTHYVQNPLLADYYCTFTHAHFFFKLRKNGCCCGFWEVCATQEDDKVLQKKHYASSSRIPVRSLTFIVAILYKKRQVKVIVQRQTTAIKCHWFTFEHVSSLVSFKITCPSTGVSLIFGWRILLKY